MPTKPHPLYAVGKTLHDFTVTKSLPIPELQCHLYELVHGPTQAQVMHIATDDPENLFCLSFQTLPHKSDGVAHILEHTVLCGSKKYPVKDPFFAMTRRSLNTFMNALTGSDFTCYPAASQVQKDFYNLLEVYLDAVFHANLNPLSFLQEGHRLEFDNPTDPNTPLEYKGIVYNEMKGALSTPTARLSEAMHAALYPDVTYGINSGGHPSAIVTLTYDELVAFYKRYYHPSRCLFFFYGNMPLERHLSFIAEHALKDVEKKAELPKIPNQPRFNAPKYLKDKYPVAAEESIRDKALISFGWLTTHILDQQDLLALSIIEIILLDTDASPLKKALLKSGLCKLVSSHIDTDVNENPFIITLVGCDAENADACEQVIRRTLEAIIDEGIPLEKVENAIHQFEIFRSEITGDHTPFGLSLFMRSALLKQHKVPAEEGLKIHSHFDGVHKKVLEDPKYLGKLIKKYLLDNPHFIRIVMEPDKSLAAAESAEERAMLDNIRSTISPEQAKTLIKQAKELAAFQKKQEEEDIDILPKVTLEDVPKMSRDFPLVKENVGNLQVFHHSCFTNKIVYADLIFNMPDVPEEDLPYVRLLTYLMPQMGAGGRSYAENLEYIQAHTGGVGATLTMNLQATDHTLFYPSLNIRGKALHRKAHKLFPLIYDLATSVNFADGPRLTEVLQKLFTAMESTINSNAMKYATNLASSTLDVPSKIANCWYGLEFFWMVRNLVQNIHQDVGKLIDKLQKLQSKLLCVENPDLVITCDAEMYNELKGKGFYGLSQLETNPSTPWKGNYPLAKLKPQGRVISAAVAFTSKAFKTISYVHPDAPALSVAACLFDNLVLHQRIREQGGAYGGGSVNNTTAGSFYFYAYRDPNISTSLAAFEEAVKTIAGGQFEESDLEEAKLEIIQGLDDPVAPGSRGDHAYGWLREGKTLKVRQAFRDRLLSLKREDVIAATNTHIIPQMKHANVVVFAGKELLIKENAVLAAQGKQQLTIETIN